MSDNQIQASILDDRGVYPKLHDARCAVSSNRLCLGYQVIATRVSSLEAVAHRRPLIEFVGLREEGDPA
jgi:hypothetical protein